MIARTVSDELSKRLGQPVMVENAAGAAGTIGAAKAVRSPADGYTLLLGSGSEISIAKLTTPSVKYDGQKDLAPITMVGTQPMILVGAPNTEPKNTAELLAYARKRLYHCPFQATKPTCGNCLIHCYTAQKRQRIQEVMRYAGPRMLFSHPILALWHLLDGLRKPRRRP